MISEVAPLEASAQYMRFGTFEVDLLAMELRKHGVKIKLQDQPFQILVMLLERPGEVVTREQLHQKLWPGGTFLDFDHGLNNAIQRLRQALGDSAENPRFVETLARRGYRFLAPVDRAVTTTPAELAPTIRVLSWILVGAVMLLLVGAGIGLWLLRPASHPAPATVPLTSYPGQQADPAFSPDGKQVAFAWDGENGDNFDIYVKLVGAGAPLRLTTNPAEERSPAWSPDGRYIAFCRALPAGAEISMVPALGGAERKLAETALAGPGRCGGLSWSQDGKFLAFVDRSGPQAPYSIFLLAIETGQKRRLTMPLDESFGDFGPRFSPDGRILAFVRCHGLSCNLYSQPSNKGGRSEGEAKQITYEGRVHLGFDWTADGRRMVYSAGQLGISNLWMIPSSGGTSERLAVAGVNAGYTSVSRAGNRLVYERDALDFNIWRIPGPASPDRKSAPSKFIASNQFDIEPQFSPDGAKIVFTSSRSGNFEIWVCNREGRNPVQLTSFDGQYVGSPRWSPDSRWIAFDSFKAGNSDVYVISADGGPSRRLTHGPSNNVRPSWSRDGRWIYFGSNRSGIYFGPNRSEPSQIWKVPAAGGEAVQVTKGGGEEAFESADGKFVYWVKPDVPGVWRVQVEGGHETQLHDVPMESLWALTGEGICFFDRGNSAGPVLKFFSFSGRATILRQFPKETRLDGSSTALSVSPDGRWILYTQLDLSGSDVMLVENFW